MSLLEEACCPTVFPMVCPAVCRPRRLPGRARPVPPATWQVPHRGDPHPLPRSEADAAPRGAAVLSDPGLAP